jgi:hypothetical protein
MVTEGTEGKEGTERQTEAENLELGKSGNRVSPQRILRAQSSELFRISVCSVVQSSHKTEIGRQKATKGTKTGGRERKNRELRKRKGGGNRRTELLTTGNAKSSESGGCDLCDLCVLCG